MTFVCSELDVKFGFWAWGHGNPDTGKTVPIAMIPHGLARVERDAFIFLGMQDASDQWVRHPFMPFFKEAKQVCGRRQDFWTDAVWLASDFRRALGDSAGLDEWMICVRYPNPQVWSCISLFRGVGKTPFSDSEQAMLDVAFAAISWLHSPSSDPTGEIEVGGLSKRNVEVLYLLLDGRSRKEIASSLELTSHVVNDCIKQIYAHFGTTSATELAAKFLKRS